MKTLILLIALSFSSLSFADTTTISASEDLNILSLVVGVHSSYSETSGFEAKAIEYLAGDGWNAVRIALVVNNYPGNSKVFDLGIALSEVKSIDFATKNIIRIKYVQDTFDSEENPTKVNKEIIIQVLKNADGSVASKIKIY